MDFSKYDTDYISQNEQFSSSISMAAGTFSDVGYRFRRNYITREDLPSPFNEYYARFSEPFYDFQFFNMDSYEVPEDTQLLAEVYFRIQLDEV